MKDRYKGVFNWYGETWILWTHATSAARARVSLFKKLADALDISFPLVSAHFTSGKGDYEIKVSNKEE